MQISSALAGYSLGKADLLRRAMGKKKKEVMEKEKISFLDGAKTKQIDPAIAEKVFDLMEKFAGYGFNRSHSAAYGLLTYYTAYCKRYHPVEFFAALLTCDKDVTESVVKFIAEARANGIPVERPDVNESEANFTVVKLAPVENGDASKKPGNPAAKKLPASAQGKAIRFGLAAVKGVGEGAVECILAARTEKGPFVTVYDFCNRVDARKVNRKVLEALVKSGAFDGVAGKTGVTRGKLFLAIGPAMDRAANALRERESGQTSLLALFAGAGKKGEPAVEPVDDSFADGEEWLPKEQLAYEKESIGFYISGHPLDRFATAIRRFANAITTNATSRGPRAEVTIGGIASNYQERPTKTGNGRFAFFTLEDQHGQIEFMVGSAKVNDYRDVLASGEPLLVTGTVDTPFGDGEVVRERLRFMSAKLLHKVQEERSSLVEIRLNADRVSEDDLKTLEKLLRAHPGSCKARLHLEIPQRSESVLELGDDYKVAATDELMSRLEALFGNHAAVLR
jgi:DNA polymerase-3 subunit alpha